MAVNGQDTEAERGLACEILSDGKIATLVWRVVPSESCPGGHLSVQVPVGGLRALRSAIHAAHVKHYGYGPLSVEVGHLEELRNGVLLTIDRDTDGPLPFILQDELATKVAKWIYEDLDGRVEESKRDMLRTTIFKPRRGIILPRK